jgi:hypothetical protein
MRKITLKEIHDRCDEVGVCWIWKDATSKGGYPIMKRSGGPCLYVRRVAAELSGKKLAKRQPVISTCQEKRCCNPAHLDTSTYKQIALDAGERGVFSTMTRRMKLAQAARVGKSAKLTIEKAREIRASTKTAKKLATEYGVNESVIKGIKGGRMWVDYANPFVALIR